MKRKIMFWISVLFQITQIVAVLMAFLYVRELNMLPDRYMKLFCVALLSSVLLAALLMFVLSGEYPVPFMGFGLSPIAGYYLVKICSGIEEKAP